VIAPAPAAARAGGAGRGGGGGAPVTRLRREPALVALAARDTGDLGRRATALLARLEWPGKPGASAPVAPLTQAEEQRFAAGEQVYQNICKACHQVDGRGLEKVAPPLIGSAYVLGPAAVTSRILLNGKEGTVGLMPPLGTTLTDDQIAAVLTFIRREWGQTGSPVDPATVKDVRAATAGRTRPWTNDELTRLINGGN
jgi:mono/diheme cytochrome c family protein